MHFVAMLGLRLPILYYYDGLITLISALVVILMIGLALLILHFRPRTPVTITLAGGIVGMGIAVMHYIGMLGMELCRPVFGLLDVGISVLASLALSIIAIWVAYGVRRQRNILLGTLCFGGAVFAVHFIAMSRTGFLKLDVADAAGPLISNETLAMGVALAAFAISGAFLLTGITFLEDPEHQPEVMQGPNAAPNTQDTAPVPYERDGRTQFAERASIAAVRAEGHYTVLYVNGEKLFCPWSISEATSRLGSKQFILAHRSYLINPAHVTEFRRTKDTAVCLFDGIDSLPKVPVSRSRLGDVRTALGV
jgi:NO-binding membrane sensor protein with MHYT domain